jgi:hypothetical protein
MSEDEDLDYQDYCYQQDLANDYEIRRWQYDFEEKAFIEGRRTKQEFLDFLLDWTGGDNLSALELLKVAEIAKKEKIQAELPSPGLDGC